MTSQPDLLRILLNDVDLVFVRLRTVGEGISADLERSEMAPRAIAIAASHGWICTLHRELRIAIEPGTPMTVTVAPHTGLYPVSDADRRADIRLDGLVPQNGGNTSLGRVYTGRLHLVVRRRDAFQFIHHQITRPSLTPDGLMRIRTFDEMDLYSVHPVPGADFFNDNHFEGRGVWTDASIPEASVRLVEESDWRPLYREMYPDDFEEDYWHHMAVTDEPD